MKPVTITDALVIAFLCLAVALGLWGSFGCTPLSFDQSAESIDEAEDTMVSEAKSDGSSGDSGESSPDGGLDVPQPDVATLDAQPDSGCVACDAALDTVREDTVVFDTGSETLKDTASAVEHRTATGETYSSALPKGIYSPGLFAESISKIEEAHPGIWSGPYDATCNLSSEGHGVAETCHMIWKTDMGVMLCPFGISYVAGSASCPPLASPVSWW